MSRAAPTVTATDVDAAPEAGGRVRQRIRIDGIVQGVGFRPFVHSLATRLCLAGFVSNDMHGVLVEVEGGPERVAEFERRVAGEAPPLAMVEHVVAEGIAVTGGVGFAILASRTAGERAVLISPDIATCDDCLDEIFDPANRRFLYPFTNCTNCGPRLTIMRDVPYDRPFTAMAGFRMCAECAREYHDPSDRRFHAQPIACPACGPRLRLVDNRGVEQEGDPCQRTAALLQAGQLVAVKGLGGYHLAAIAANETAVGRLRARKHREDKPFAIMVPSLAAAHQIAFVDPVEERVLTSRRRPIVLLRRRPDAPLASSVAPANRCVGVMLPYTPVHHLLCHHLNVPFVLTSGNVSDEPIAYADADAFGRLSSVADFFLTHDRPIESRTDDSVVRVFGGREMPIRRSRGYAPQPLVLPWRVCRPILACGAELKNTFCLATGRYALVSPHIGDLENYETLQSFTGGIKRFARLFDVSPQVVAYDWHPEYLSTKYALALDGVDLVGVQHHHAHVAACLADNNMEGPAIGVAFDGLGYGGDNSFWGGEFLVADLANFERIGSFETVPMPGGTAAIKQPWRMAAAYLDTMAGGGALEDLDVFQRNRRRWSQVVALARAGVHAPPTSSVGRLFDAVGAILGVRDEINYEGQAAVELEQLADPTERGAYHARVGASPPYRVRGGDLVHAVVTDLRSGTAPAVIAARFHNALARVIVDVCSAIRARNGLTLVALSGGVFQNVFLLERTVRGLETCGFRVLTHSQVPTNDGGISFGQAVVAGARDQVAAASLGRSGFIDGNERLAREGWQRTSGARAVGSRSRHA